MKTFFYYGVMKASKSAQLVLKASTYQAQDIEPIIIKPSTDTRDKQNIVYSRIGISIPVTYIIEPDDIKKVKMIISQAIDENKPVFVDESQFLSTDALNLLTNAPHLYDGKSTNFNVFLYGLLKTYDNKLFDGSKAIIQNADELIEITTKCEKQGCNNKATCNLLSNVKTNSDIVIGDKNYHVYCQKHYLERMASNHVQ